MSFTADAFISNIESRHGWNGQHVWNFYGLKKGTPWCDGEISYAFNKIGARKKWCGGKPSFYVPEAQAWMAKHWQTVYDYRGKGSIKNVKKGDVIIFMWTKGSRDHIGAAREDGTVKNKNGETCVLTVEGNTSGGIVDDRTRAKKYIFAVYRPPWNGGTGPDPIEPLDVDGEMGLLTKERLQRWLDVEEDGQIGPDTTKALQKKVGLTGKNVDGEWGPITTKALQKYLGVKQTGKMDKDTVKALQKYLNKVVTK